MNFFGNLRGREVMWGYFCGSTTKIPPHLPPTPEIPREPFLFRGKPYSFYTFSISG
jgi:hypothetical protein